MCVCVCVWGRALPCFGPGRGCSGLAATTPGDVIFGSIVEEVLPPVWWLLTSTILSNLPHLRLYCSSYQIVCTYIRSGGPYRDNTGSVCVLMIVFYESFHPACTESILLALYLFVRPLFCPLHLCWLGSPVVFSQCCVTPSPAKTTRCRPEGAPRPPPITLRWLALVPLLISPNAHWRGPLKWRRAARTLGPAQQKQPDPRLMCPSMPAGPWQWAWTAGAPVCNFCVYLGKDLHVVHGEVDMWTTGREEVLCFCDCRLTDVVFLPSSFRFGPVQSDAMSSC